MDHKSTLNRAVHDSFDSLPSLLYSDETLLPPSPPKAQQQRASSASCHRSGRVWSELTTEAPTSPRVFTAAAVGMRLPNTRREAGPAVLAGSRQPQQQLVQFLLSRVIGIETMLARATDVNEILAMELLMAHGGDFSKLSSTAKKVLDNHSQLQSEEAVIPGGML